MQGRRWQAERYEQKGNAITFKFSGGCVIRVLDTVIDLDDWFLSRIMLLMRFTFSADRETLTLSADSAPERLAILQQLIGQEVVEARVDRHGFLHLAFSGSATIQAPTDEGEFRYEAWHIQDRDGFHVVCAVGGSIAIWKPDRVISKTRNKNDEDWRG
jgi:hypothetical protein